MFRRFLLSDDFSRLTGVYGTGTITYQFPQYDPRLTNCSDAT
jgi:hypothetical protein